MLKLCHVQANLLRCVSNILFTIASNGLGVNHDLDPSIGEVAVGIEIVRRMFCDFCQRTFGDGLLDEGITVFFQRNAARKNGWKRINGKDYCGKCELEPPKEEGK